jgi:hypothetical protein
MPNCCLLRGTVYSTLSMMASHIQNLSQFLQSFGVAALALLFVPALIAALARNVALALAASLLSLTSLMLFIAPASATSGLAIVSGLGSFLVALESVIARRRMMTFNKQVADLTSRVNELEGAEARRYMLELKRRGNRQSTARAKRRVGADDPEAGRNSKGTAPLGYESAALRSTDPK